MPRFAFSVLWDSGSIGCGRKAAQAQITLRGDFLLAPSISAQDPGLGPGAPKISGGPTSPGVTHAELSKPQHAIC